MNQRFTGIGELKTCVYLQVMPYATTHICLDKENSNFKFLIKFYRVKQKSYER